MSPHRLFMIVERYAAHCLDAVRVVPPSYPRGGLKRRNNKLWTKARLGALGRRVKRKFFRDLIEDGKD